MDGSRNSAGPRPAGTIETDPADEIARLLAENARLRGQLGPAAEHRAAGRWRASFAALLITIGVILAPVSVVAYWTKGYINDTDRFVASLAPLAEDPAVQAYLVDEIVAVVNDNVDIEGITSDLFDGLANLNLPPAAQNALSLLEQPAVQGVQGLIQSAATNIVASDAFAQLWEQALRTSQTQVIAALEGDSSGALVISDTGEIGIQLGPIIDEVKTELVNRGFSLAQNIPEVDRTIVVAQSDSLVQARTGYQLLNLLGFILPLVSLGLIALGVLVAKRRSRTLIWAGLTLALAMAILAAGIAVGRILFVSALSPTYLPNNVAQALYDAVVPFINTTALSVGLVGFTVAVVAYLAGPFRGSGMLRRSTIGTAASLRAAAGNAGITTGGFGAFLYRYRRLAHVLIGLAAAAVAIFWRPLTPPVIIWSAVLALVAVLLVEVLQRPSVGPPTPPRTGAAPGDGPGQGARTDTEANPTLPLPPGDPDNLRGQTGPTEPLEPIRADSRPD